MRLAALTAALARRAGGGGVTPAARRLLALDFDGVICDSCGESSLAAWKAATKLWPDLMGTPETLQRRDQVLDDMRAVRPVVETGADRNVPGHSRMCCTPRPGVLGSKGAQESERKCTPSRQARERSDHPIRD